jgi:diamine N-acetyltransferase
MGDVRLVPVGPDNWRACVALQVRDGQRRWVADVSYYLCLCTFGDTWHPLAVEGGGEVVGFLMWGVDDDGSRWIGGVVIDRARQGQGLGRTAMVEVVRLLAGQKGCTDIALSYAPDNVAARDLYRSLGFVETGETEDDGAELVARLPLPEARRLLSHGRSGGGA